jgi:hypothetical protein
MLAGRCASAGLFASSSRAVLRNRPVAPKQQMIDSLGEQPLLLPAKVNAGLVANDHAKYPLNCCSPPSCTPIAFATHFEPSATIETDVCVVGPVPSRPQARELADPRTLKAKAVRFAAPPASTPQACGRA